jgi:preprotein translocase subunit SecG
MLLTLANILYVLVAAAMIVLILLQRGAGASAGSGFGGGASATVFGARGSANFLSKSTAILATLFFVISLGMAMYASRSANIGAETEDLGVMGALAPAGEVPAAPAAGTAVPAPAAEVPAAPTAEAAPAAGAEGAPTNAEETPVEAEEKR